MGDYFQKWGTIFFWPGIRFGASISEGGQFHPVWDYIILYVKRGGVAVGPLGPPIVSGPRCQTGCCLHRRRFAQKRQKDPVGSCREGFCEMPSTPSTPSGTGNPLGFCSVEESTGGRGFLRVSIDSFLSFASASALIVTYLRIAAPLPCAVPLGWSCVHC